MSSSVQQSYGPVCRGTWSWLVVVIMGSMPAALLWSQRPCQFLAAFQTTVLISRKLCVGPYHIAICSNGPHELMTSWTQ